MKHKQIEGCANGTALGGQNLCRSLRANQVDQSKFRRLTRSIAGSRRRQTPADHEALRKTRRCNGRRENRVPFGSVCSIPSAGRSSEMPIGIFVGDLREICGVPSGISVPFVRKQFYLHSEPKLRLVLSSGRDHENVRATEIPKMNRWVQLLFRPRTTHSTHDKKARTVMKKAELKNFEKPDEVREFPKGRLELIQIGGATVGVPSSSQVGGGRPPFSQSPKPKAVKRRIFNITSPVSCEFAWTTAWSSTASQATSPCCPPVTTPGWSGTNRR